MRSIHPHGETHFSGAGRRAVCAARRSAGALSSIIAALAVTYGPSVPLQGAECLSWRIRTPAERYYSAMAFDSDRGVTVLFGGQDNDLELGDTWEFDGNSWTLRSTSGPDARLGAAMAYDSLRGVTVLFGGRRENSSRRDTWEWDGTSWALRNEGGAGLPGGRYGHSMVFDTAQGVTILFGGRTSVFGNHYSDTWEWDGTDWIQRSTTGPFERGDAAMAYDPVRNVTTLYGGAKGRGKNNFTLSRGPACSSNPAAPRVVRARVPSSPRPWPVRPFRTPSEPNERSPVGRKSSLWRECI